jgi:hypothetical protein
MSLRWKSHPVRYTAENFSKVRKSQYPAPVLAKNGLADSWIAEDNMNVQLKDITVTARDGRVSHLDQVYIRGSHIRFFIVPDMLRYDGLGRHQIITSYAELTCTQERSHV